MSESPIELLLGAIDKLDADAAIAQLASDCRLLMADGRRAEGADAIREVVTSFLAALHSTKHRITRQWHQDNVWIAEVEASYELQDSMQLNALPRALVLHEGARGVTELHVYGAHERPLSEHRTGGEGMWIADHWIPPL